MKNITVNSILLVGVSLLLSCEEDISSMRTSEGLTGTYQTRSTIITPAYFTLRFDLSDRRDGTYRVGKNSFTGSQINILIREGGVAAFQVFRKDGSLVQPHGTSQGPTTPDHSKDPQIICTEGVEIFYDPVYGYLFKQHGDCDTTNPIVEIIIDTRY